MSSLGGFRDRNLRSYTTDGEVDLSSEELNSLDSSIDDTLKVSNARQVVIGNKTVFNYGEDCVDLCRVHSSELRDLTIEAGGKNGITIKGASSNIFITNLTIAQHGRTSDIELGQFDNYWTPGRLPTRLVEISGRSAVGQTARIWLWDAEAPDLTRFTTPVKITRVPKAVWLPYFLFRYTQIRAYNLIAAIFGLEKIKTQ